MATYNENEPHEKLGWIITVAGIAISVSKAIYDEWKAEEARKLARKVDAAGTVEYTQLLIDQGIQKGLTGVKQQKTTTYLAIGAAALISLIALTK